MSKRGLRIGLFGIGGVYNFGCEAIVRGAYEFINDLFIEPEIKYFSFSYEYDVEHLSDLDIEIINVNKNNSTLKRVVNKVLRIMRVNKRILLFDYNRIISQVDVILSIGGDIYTIPQVIRNQSKYEYYNSLIDFCDKVIKNGKDVIVYGASVGPWGEYKKAVEYYVNAMRKYQAIICREKESLLFLNKVGIGNALCVPDPAFQLREKKSNKKNAEYIGINFSPLSFKEIYGYYDKRVLKQLANIIDEIHTQTKMPIMLLPHVLSTDDSDNDLLFLNDIKNLMSNSKSVYLADVSKGFLGIKKYIRKCHIVVAARMHCAINAIEENVPTIFISYSKKSVGMCEYVYGNNEWCIRLEDLKGVLLEKVLAMIKNRDYIVDTLELRNDRIAKEYKENVEMLKKSKQISEKY